MMLVMVSFLSEINTGMFLGTLSYLQVIGNFFLHCSMLMIYKETNSFLNNKINFSKRGKGQKCKGGRRTWMRESKGMWTWWQDTPSLSTLGLPHPSGSCFPRPARLSLPASSHIATGPGRKVLNLFCIVVIECHRIIL